MNAQLVIEHDSMCSRHIAITSDPEVQGNILGPDVTFLHQEFTNKNLTNKT